MTEWHEGQGKQQESGTEAPLFLTIDQGGHASRVIVFDQTGEKIVEARQTVGISYPQPNWAEQDAEALVVSVQSALSDALQELGERRQHIVSAGLVTQRSNIVCWDRDTGRALSPAISWQDRRAHAWLQTFKLQTENIRHITGLQPTAHYGVSKIHWCLEHLEEVAEAQVRGTLGCGPLASFLLFRLLKEQPFVVDSVNASRTLLWDRQIQQWSDELLGLFGLETSYLPTGVPNQYDFGNLAFDEFPVSLSAPSSVPFSIPLTVCSGDQSAALFSTGMPNENCAYINMGTGAFIQCISKKALPARLLQSVVWNEPGECLQVMEATVNGAGSALTVVENELGFSSQQAQSQYAHWLATVSDIPLYLNGVSGLGSPFWWPDFVSRFVDDKLIESKAESKLVAVMESILFLVQVNLEELKKERVDVQKIVISGGLSVLDELCQRLADVSGLLVKRPKQSEATAKGLAFLLMKTFSSGAEIIWGIESSVDVFTPKENSALLERYQNWHHALHAELAKKKAL